MIRLRLLLIIPGAIFLIGIIAFEFGFRHGKSKVSPAGTTPEQGRQDDAQLIGTLLAQDLDERRFAFPVVVKAATGHGLRAFKRGDAPAETIATAIQVAADEAIEKFSEAGSPLFGLRRINEASRFFEDFLRASIDAHPDLFCTVPTTADGGEQRSGYPDLRIEHIASETIAYLDPKLYEAGNRDSSLRTFYYTPRQETSKVQEDACHLLLGISHDGNDGAWTFTGWELIDLAKLSVRLKAEFQASNRDLYLEEAQILTSGN